MLKRSETIHLRFQLNIKKIFDFAVHSINKIVSLNIK